ncbi:MAG: PDZ domain-containing protein [Planctomycetales bacterium]|nr:PDZ domain-containing protein [Planctomycetales bacterium]NIN78466.1 PDZ domain-containing protein [Planctomycetales bacterium]NIO35656.1 PDZ domain-containing protein [Planctomycetales bacterium]
MTRLNLNLLWLTTLFSFLCYSEVHIHPYGRYFVQALETIHRRGLEEIDRQTLFDAAVRAMAQEHDPYSNFVTRKLKERYQSELEQQFSGIGIRVEQDRETKDIVVVDTIVGMPHPAHDSGMRRGDRIVAIDGQPVKDEPYAAAVQRIRGPVGEPVVITILRETESQPRDLVVMRSQIAVDSVLGDARDADGHWRFRMTVDPRIAYIRLTTFGDRTADELRKVLEKLDKQKQLQALILDVRDNEGGYLETAVEICDLFVREGPIVSTRQRNGKIRDAYMAKAPGTYTGFPMVVLVNGESASASEILAACIQDHHRGAIIGQRTFGKGSVQQMIPLEGNRSLLKLTMASYWRPSGENIHRLKNAQPEDTWGVRPDEGWEVKLTAEQEQQRTSDRRYRDRIPTSDESATPSLPQADLQLQKAVEYLQAQLGGLATR